MLRCIVVDDERGAIEVLSLYVKKTPGLELLGTFQDSIEALSFMASNRVDIAFLDIDMPNLDGMQLSELIKEKSISVIFCTAYAEYAVESYEKEALDYLLKPFPYERFLKAVEKAKKVYPEERERGQTDAAPKGDGYRKIFLKSGSRFQQIDTGEVLYIKKTGHYVLFHTPKGELLSRMNMNDLLDALPLDKFVRIHRSFVVAIDKIDTIDKHWVSIKGKKIPIGDSYREAFFKRIPYSGN